MSERQVGDMEDEEAKAALLDEATRHTNEISVCRDKIAALGVQRRQLFAALRSLGVTYRELAAATGLHKVTIQADMARFREEYPEEMWSAFTRKPSKAATNSQRCPTTDSPNSEQAAVASSASKKW